MWKVTRGFGTSCFYIIRYSLVLDQSILYPVATHGPLRFNNGVFSETQTNNSSNPITQASGNPGQGLFCAGSYIRHIVFSELYFF